jgi:hypothetical protein
LKLGGVHAPGDITSVAARRLQDRFVRTLILGNGNRARWGVCALRFSARGEATWRAGGVRPWPFGKRQHVAGRGESNNLVQSNPAALRRVLETYWKRTGNVLETYWKRKRIRRNMMSYAAATMAIDMFQRSNWLASIRTKSNWWCQTPALFQE